MTAWETVQIGHDTRIKKWVASETMKLGNTEFDKISRYGWTIADKIGRYALIDKQKLHIGYYQRNLNNNRVLNLAKEWSWIACGAIIVAYRNGIYYVIEGHHRVAAAMKRSDIGELPCLIFEVESVKQEAEGFYRSNVNRKNATPAERLMPLVAMGNSIAIAIVELIQSSGRKLTDANSTTTIKCIGTLMQLGEINMDKLKHIWPLLIEITKKKPFHEKIVTGLFYIETHITEGESLMDINNYNRILSIGYDNLLEGIHKASAYYAKGGNKVCAQGILEIINKRLRKNKITLKGEEII